MTHIVSIYNYDFSVLGKESQEREEKEREKERELIFR